MSDQKPSTLNHQAVLLHKSGHTQQAIAIFHQILNQDPNHLQALTNLGNLLQTCDPDSAVSYLHHALEVDPRSPSVHYLLATILGTQGDIESCITHLQTCLSLNPHFPQAISLLYPRLLETAAWQPADKLKGLLLSLTRQALISHSLPPLTPFAAATTTTDLAYTKQIAKSWSQHYTAQVAPFAPHFQYAPRHSPLRLGYLSSDFRDHATSHLIRQLFALHNRSQFTVYAYSYGPADTSSYRHELRVSADVFRDISTHSDLETAHLIHQDQIDLLIDLKGYTEGSRPGILALRPAPIQLHYLGYPGTLGADFIDYLLADSTVIPPRDQAYYHEKILYLPHTYQITDDAQPIATTSVTPADFGLNPSAFTFASFNQPYKITPTVFQTWMTILKRCPQSQLWLWAKNSLAAHNLRAAASSSGVDPARLVFSSSLPKPEHLKRLQLASVCLDPFPYNGHTSTSDALYAGVPIITVKGNSFASRVSESLLSALGLPELVTPNLKSYLALATKLYRAPAQLQALKTKISQHKTTHPLFQTQSFVHSLESLLLSIPVPH